VQILKNKYLRIAAVVVVLIGLYTCAGFWLAPKLVRSALMKDIPASIDATPAVGEIRINPFLFQATVADFSLTARDGEKLLGFKRLFIDFQVSSLWHRAYTFANIDLTAPQVSALIAQDGRLNLLQLQPKTAQPKPVTKSEPLPALRIGSFKVSQGLLTYEDRSRPDPFAARLEPINFELRDFTTGLEGGKFTLTGASKLGEKIEFHGRLSVDPIESDGEFQVNGLLAHTLWEYLQDQLNFVIDTGTIDIAATYKFSLKDPAVNNLFVDLSKVAVRDLTVRPKAGAEDTPAETPVANWITVPEFSVTGTTVDLPKHQAHVDLVSLKGAKLVTWLEPDGSVNLLKLAAAPGAPAAAAPAAAATVAPTLTTGTSSGAPAAAGGAPWSFDLRQFEIVDANISAEDRSVHPAVKVNLAPLSVVVTGASQDLSKPVKMTFDTRINDKGSLNVTGDVTPQPLAADVNVKLADIDLTAVQPYITQQTAMTLKSGKLGGDAKVHYGSQQGKPALLVGGNLSVTGVRTVDDDLHEDFINWERLDISGLNYGKNPDRLDIDQVTARKLYARIIIETDASMNVKRVLRIPTVVAASDDGTVKVTQAPPVAVAGAGAANGTGKAGKDGKGTAAAAPPPVVAQGMPMSIKKVALVESQANFTDMSITPIFSAGIQKLEGSVTGLSSKPSSRAKVDLKGALEAFSPVSITGEINVLGPLYTDLAMSFRNISLAVFNPYSGKFAGYSISKGKLTTELHYKVDGRKLDAQHHIVIEQLEFGDKTASKEAVSLPIKLAVALLKDRNGVIDLNVPVDGSLDDPRFRLAPIIWKVFVNILEKAVTAPFALLGSLFGGGPDIQFIAFQPGVGTLDAAASDKARAVGKALVERPQLKIDVPLGYVTELDRPALVATQYEAKVNAALAAKAGGKKAPAAGASPASLDQLDAANQAELLGKLYEKELGSEAKFPESVTGLKSKPEVLAAKIAYLGNAIREHIVVSDGDLQTLGQQRAVALQSVLLADPQVVAERVFLVANDKAVAKDGAVELELTLQ
jgi:hypothetical protein